MAAHQQSFRLKTKGNTEVRDITVQVEDPVAKSGITNGIVNVAGKGSTLGITTIEFEPGAVSDLKRALDSIAPVSENYAHNARWDDHNGYAHLRSALMGTAKSFPVVKGRLYLGTWQQIVLCDFDDRPREREITVTVTGD
jgi:secondary thiamine-phosphate synthase enzyme